MEKVKKVVTGFDEVEEEKIMAYAWILDLACRMSPSQVVWRNYGQQGLCRSKG